MSAAATIIHCNSVPACLALKFAVSLLQAATLPISLASKAPQIIANHRAKSTGNLSAFAVFNALLGCIARLFTTLQEVKDPLIFWGFAGESKSDSAQISTFPSLPIPAALRTPMTEIIEIIEFILFRRLGILTCHHRRHNPQYHSSLPNDHVLAITRPRTDDTNKTAIDFGRALVG